MIIFSYIFTILIIIFAIGVAIYLFRGPGSSGYYRRGRRY